MPIELRPYRPEYLAALRAVVRHPSLASDFDVLSRAGGVEEKLADPHLEPDRVLIAMADGVPAGFGLAFVLPGAEGAAWAALRLGVVEPLRRRGIGSAILRDLEERIASLDPPGGIHELGLAAYLPNDAAEAFVARHGFSHARFFWRMERAAEPAPEVRWPPGITARMFDGSEGALAGWNAAYNAAFAEHYQSVPSTLDDLRRRVRQPGFLADGALLAYRGETCVGFCHNERIGSTGIVGVLGTIPQARGMGLGRAMLRWAVASFGRRGFERVGLMVDGKNEGALTLYRTEGFTIARTRRLWSRPPDRSRA